MIAEYCVCGQAALIRQIAMRVGSRDWLNGCACCPANVPEATKTVSVTERDAKLDYEAFAQAMLRIRNWNQARAHSAWEELRANVEVTRDFDGPAHSKLRLNIPSSLMAGGFTDMPNSLSKAKSLTSTRTASYCVCGFSIRWGKGVGAWRGCGEPCIRQISITGNVIWVASHNSVWRCGVGHVRVSAGNRVCNVSGIAAPILCVQSGSRGQGCCDTALLRVIGMPSQRCRGASSLGASKRAVSAILGDGANTVQCSVP